MARAGTVSLSLDDIQIGSCCDHPIQDETGLLLVDSTTPITKELLDGLRERGIEQIEVDEGDAELLRGQLHSRTEQAASVDDYHGDEQEAPVLPRVWLESQPLKSMLVDRHDEGLNSRRSARLSDALSNARKMLEGLVPTKAGLDEASVSACGDISDAYARAIVDDCDQTLGSFVAGDEDDDLSQRSIRMAVMAMAVGVELGLDGTKTVELGTAGLLHDIGLLMMDSKFTDPTQPLTEADLWEHQKHPQVTLDYLRQATELTQGVESGIEQLHEQYDGTGYPRGMSGRRIHLHARILNVVDAFLQLTSASLNRPPIVPHDALGMLLHQATRGKFDPKVVCAFLATETLFPLGSSVELDSGEVARVIRRPRSGYAFPVLLNLHGERIELESSSREIIRPAIDPERKQIRLSIAMMQTGRDLDGVSLLAI